MTSHQAFYQVSATAIPTLLVAVAVQRGAMLDPSPDRAGRLAVFHRLSHAVLVLAGAACVVGGEWQALLSSYRGHDEHGAAKSVDIAFAVLFGLMLVPTLRPAVRTAAEEMPERVRIAIAAFAMLALVLVAAVLELVFWTT